MFLQGLQFSAQPGNTSLNCWNQTIATPGKQADSKKNAKNAMPSKSFRHIILEHYIYTTNFLFFIVENRGLT